MKLNTRFSKFTIAEIVGAAITGIFWLYLANLIEPEQYGEIHYIIGIASIGSIVSIFGAGNSVIVFISKGKSNGTIFIIISLLIGLAAFLTTTLVLNRIDVGILIFSFIVFQLGVAFLQGHRNYKKYLIYVLSHKIAFVIFGLILTFSNYIEFIIYGFSFSYFGFIIIILTNFKRHEISLDIIKNNFIFVISNYITSLFSILRDNVDKIIIVPILGYALLGNYSLALQAIMILNIFSNMITRYMLPIQSAGESIEKFRKIILYSSFPLLILAFFVIPELILLFFEKYNFAINAIKILAFSIPAFALVNILNTKFVSLEKTEFVLIGLGTLLSIQIPGMIILGSFYELAGISIAYVTSIHIQLIALHVFDRRLKFKNNQKMS